MVPSLDREEEVLRGGAETRGLLRLPVRVERPGDVFTPSVLSVRWVPGRRILSNATPANSLFAPTCDRPENAECNAPPLCRGSAPPAATSLKLTPMGGCRTIIFSALRALGGEPVGLASEAALHGWRTLIRVNPRPCAVGFFAFFAAIPFPPTSCDQRYSAGPRDRSRG
jgi:hypothetical protein